MRGMPKECVLALMLITLTLSLGCQYSVESSCATAGCRWLNSTCLLGTGACLSGSVWSNSTSECVVCSTLSSSQCSVDCVNYYYKTAGSICQTCANINPYCLTCDETKCKTCETNFEVSLSAPKECLPKPCLIKNCVQCDSASTCYACGTSYVVTTARTACSLAICSIPNCLFCLSASSCLNCRSGYALSADATTCSLICADPNCGACSSATSCSTCLAGYAFNSGTGRCKLICQVENCQECDLSSTCTTCKTGMVVNAAKTLCSVVCTDVNCVACSASNVCSNCKSGYYLKANGVCTKAICYISNCVTCKTSTTCATCDGITTLNGNGTLCTQNCLNKVANCKSCSSNTTCLACKAGFKLDTNANTCGVVCSVANCAVCLSASLCQFCSNGYIASADSLSCIFNCGIANCLDCASSTTCKTCAAGFTLADAKDDCSLACAPGSYPDTALTPVACALCSSAITGCSTCQKAASGVVCSRCWETYYLTGSGSCLPCSSAMPACVTCSSPSVCTQCSATYVLNANGTCVSQLTCNVNNCKICVPGDPSKCSLCYDSYQSSSDLLSCTLIGCLSTQFYDPASGGCVCPAGSYLSGGVCAYCNVKHCLSCNSAGCVSCKGKFYPSEGECVKCSDNCVSCSSGSSCTECDFGYSLLKGKCREATELGKTEVSSASQTGSAVCPPGCSKCSYANSAIFCVQPLDGYSFDTTGGIARCDSACLTCATTNSAICTSCFGASVLSGSTCVGCTDKYALNCPKDINYATGCITGYSPFAGVCKACSTNCRSCGNSKAGQCDEDGCNDGYVKIVGTLNCTRCFLGCASCDPADPSYCLSCSGSDYLSNTSSCNPCPSACLTCSSQSVCTSCPPGSLLSNNFCFARIPYPCSEQTNSSCTACYMGYNLVGGSCQIDNSCNGTASCLTCAKGNYLSKKQCFRCSTSSATCDFCDPNKPTQCLTCAAGYFLDGNTCASCPAAITGCLECTSKNKCSKAANGYFLAVDEKERYSGKVEQCKDSCATCTRASSCDSCASNYVRFGSSCLFSAYITGSVTLKSGTNATAWISENEGEKDSSLATGLASTNQIQSALIVTAGYKDKVDNDKIIMNKLRSGSIIADFTIATDPSQDAALFSSNFNAALLGGKMPDFTVFHISTSNNGFTTDKASSWSSANLGLILGITIPLVILLGVIIVFIKISSGGETETPETKMGADESNKEIEQYDI